MERSCGRDVLEEEGIFVSDEIVAIDHLSVWFELLMQISTSRHLVTCLCGTELLPLLVVDGEIGQLVDAYFYSSQLIQLLFLIRDYLTFAAEPPVCEKISTPDR